jgi:hypothetical protein
MPKVYGILLGLAIRLAGRGSLWLQLRAWANVTALRSFAEAVGIGGLNMKQ